MQMPSNPAAVEAGPGIQETQFTATADEAQEAFENSQDPDRVEYAQSEAHDANKASYGTLDNPLADDGTTTQNARKSAASSRALAPDLLRGLLMVLMAIDHCAVSQGAWRHGVALESESDGSIVNTWNEPVAWTARMLTHLCAPGFMFLLGMGIIYFGRSRSKLGWSSWQMAKHFAIRAFVLAVLNELFTIPFGGRYIILNFILLSLAINYLLAGLIWLAVSVSEKFLATLLKSFYEPPDDDARRSLLADDTGPQSHSSALSWASDLSWHIHNAFLLILTIITIAWNHWLSPHQGHCPTNIPSNHSGPTQPSGTSLGPWSDFWFLPITTKLVISPFPPLGWLSPAILGLLYGRIVLSRAWKTYTINASNVFVGVFLMLLFALTRLLHFGNLSEDCLRMPEQLASPAQNQYLASFRSFFYITKYPPSFSYLAFTMSLNFLLLALFGALPEKLARRIPALLTFGQSALFFYVVHLVLYFWLLAPLVKALFGHELGYTDPFNGKPVVGTSGEPAVMWVTLVVGLAVMWPLCRWYGGFKSTKEVNSVWRFF